jgi:small conductance mechanosensitive channel
MDMNSLLASANAMVISFGWKLLGALALWIVGRALIKVAMRLLGGGMRAQGAESTLVRYVQNTVSVLLTVVLVIAILEVFDVQATTFAALLAGAGLAIGAAWSGLLANFASGAFLILLRPFKVGDFVSAGGVTGTVEEIGIFSTTINTPDNLCTFVGNGKIFSDNIVNFSANPWRRKEITAQVSHALDPVPVMNQIGERIRAVPNVLSTPAPEIEMLSWTPTGCIIAVRPCCKRGDYWQVDFDAQRQMREVLGSGGFPKPELVAELNAAG